MPKQTPDLFGRLGGAGRRNYGPPTVYILGRTVHVMGATDAKAEKVLQGMTVASARGGGVDHEDAIYDMWDPTKHTFPQRA